MSWQDLGGIGDLIGGIAVVLSLVYIAYQIRQSSRLIEQNSRNLEASVYTAVGDAFNRWWYLIAQDEKLASLWIRGLAGESLLREDQLRFEALLTSLFITYENNFHQIQLGSIRRRTLDLSRDTLARLLASPGAARWWERQAPRMLTPEFRSSIEALLARQDAHAAARGGDREGAGA